MNFFFVRLRPVIHSGGPVLRRLLVYKHLSSCPTDSVSSHLISLSATRLVEVDKTPVPLLIGVECSDAWTIRRRTQPQRRVVPP